MSMGLLYLAANKASHVGRVLRSNQRATLALLRVQFGKQRRLGIAMR